MPLAAENALFHTIGEIFHPLFVGIAAVLAWIYGIVPNYAAAIVILTVLIMALLTPLTIKGTRSMLAMQSLQPEMQKLRAKYKGAENREQLNQEMMRLYREHGVSPTGGCLPMFLQMPALVVLYDTIRGLANTVKRGQLLGTGKLRCHSAVCATPRYVPHSSAIYHNLIKTPGVMKSIGLNLAAKPLTHRGVWYDYIPYFALIAVAVGLQYFQMAQMTARNKRNNTAQSMPQQMQTMQRIMPLFFAYIYFLVPAGVVIYMIVSSAIRVLTQDLIFRYGLVQSPGQRQIGGGKGNGKAGAVPAASEVVAPRRRPGGPGQGQGAGGRREGAGPAGAGSGAEAGNGSGSVAGPPPSAKALGTGAGGTAAGAPTQPGGGSGKPAAGGGSGAPPGQRRAASRRGPGQAPRAAGGQKSSDAAAKTGARPSSANGRGGTAGAPPPAEPRPLLGALSWARRRAAGAADDAGAATPATGNATSGAARTGRAAPNGRRASAAAPQPEAKPHPRSKSKKPRKAR